MPEIQPRSLPTKSAAIRQAAFLLTVAASLFLASCASLSHFPADQWLGLSKDQLLQQMGSPTSKVSDGHGGEILVYVVSRYTLGGPCLGQFGVGHCGSDQYYEVSRFFIDPTGTIYKHEVFPV